jgi:gamma-glutamylcyclotransferase (GGCT)/AIG2-like uncharacterized protein YtfP
MEQTKQLYFAYGSNLNKNDWNKYCRDKGIDPGIMQPVAPATLPDEVLVFDHYSSRRNSWTLNIRPHFGSLVEGYLFAVTQVGWDVLDKKEGHPNAYQRETVIVLDANGGEVKATTYRSKRPHGLERPNDAKPCDDYLDICRAGRERFELDTIDIDLAAENEGYSCNLVFVYGTLMRGESRASAWEDLNPDRVLLANSPGTLLDHGSYPGLRASSGCLNSFPRMISGVPPGFVC